ncbi:hypothetical protein KR074_012481 [Drosophila pseudoananassae]|nr:hypothetical protein KR074_012481 [Drosophila pseudoananassae]
MVLSAATSKNTVFLAITTLILFVCFVAVAATVGFRHESEAYTNGLIVVAMVMVLQYLIFDPIKFLILAFDHAVWPQDDAIYHVSKSSVTQSRFDGLKMRLSSFKSELLITDEHRNEKLNEKYGRIAKELVLYGSYFFSLLLIVVVHVDQQLYYNTNIMYQLFNFNTKHTMGLSKIYFQYEVFPYIEKTLIESFYLNNGNWWAMDQAQLMGVVRLRQMRLRTSHIGLDDPKWDSGDYLPEWTLPYQRLHYKDKFWRIYDPFLHLPSESSFLNSVLLNFNHYGAVHVYPESGGYCSYLMAKKINSLKVLEYLRAYSWMGINTSALFLDFTLYSADANVFSVVTLRVENSMFGLQCTNTDVESVRLIQSAAQKSTVSLFVNALYVVLMIQFMRSLFVKLWFDPKVIKEIWNMVDLCICVMNVVLVVLKTLLEWEKTMLCDKIMRATRAQYLNFLRPMRVDQLTSIILGFLVAATTLRLWKVLQFARVFQHFTHTLSSAWRATASLGLAIIILLTAIGVASSVPNGSNAILFRHFYRAIITCFWYSMGFNGGMVPSELFYGGMWLGLCFYLFLVFIVAIVMMNVFASLIYDYFIESGHELKEHDTRCISFFAYLNIEFADVKNRFFGWFGCCRKKYRRKGYTVAENVRYWSSKRMVKHYHHQKEHVRVYDRVREGPSETYRQEDYHRKVRRMYKVADILMLQLEILKRRLVGDENGNLSSSDGSDSDPEDMPELYKNRKSKKNK